MWLRSGYAAVVFRARRRIGQRFIRAGEIGGLARGDVLEFLAEMLDLVGVVLRDFAAKGSLNFVGRCVGRDVEKIVEGFGHGDRHFLNSATLAAGGSSRIGRCSRS